MGYSIAARARNQKLRVKMVEFMGKNWRKWSDVLGKGESISSRPGLEDEGGKLDYDRSKDAVGFDYASHCHGWERCFIYCEIRWVAIKIGKRKTKFSKDDVTPNVFPEPVPFMVYDGYQSWPILVVKNLKEAMKLPKGNRWCATDSLGVYIGPEANSILTTYASRIYGTPLYAAFNKELGKLGERPKEPKAFEEWMERYEALKVKHMRGEIDEVLPIIRKEVARLDKLWEAQA